MARFSPLMIAPPVIFGVFITLAAMGMFRENPDALPSVRVGQTAPPVVLTVLPGRERFTDADLRTGELSLVNFWASWCPSCRVEHPTLMQLGKIMPLFGVNYKDKPERALAFLRELGDPYRASGADVVGRMSMDWGVYGVPETYLIDGDGTILLRIAGPVTQRVLESTLRPAIEAAQKAAEKAAQKAAEKTPEE